MRMLVVCGWMLWACLGTQGATAADKPARLKPLAESPEFAEDHVYKEIDEHELHAYVVKPPHWKAGDSRPAIVFFHGGGWTGGTPGKFRHQSEYFAGRGLVCVNVQYRLLSRETNDPPEVCIRDAKSAMRWVRANAQKLGIDPARVAASGGSAGGHLAAAVALLEGHDEPSDDRVISPKANALILFNPVIDNGPGGFGIRRVGDRVKEFSPAANVTSAAPPTILFVGSLDTVCKPEACEKFRAEMQAAGVPCELLIYDGQPHGFFNYREDNLRYYHQTVAETDRFLTALGWTEAPVRPVQVVTEIAAKLEPTRSIIYKKVDGRELRLDLFEPKGWQPGDRRAAFVAFHGGGWTSGEPRRQYPFTAHYAERGLVGISVQYRLVDKARTVTPFDCVKDARSALRYLKSHAAELGIDPEKIAVSGGSAGGHLAAATALFDEVNEETDDPSVSPTPAALVLQYPVIDTSPLGYGNAKCGPDWKRISPVDRVRSRLPPTIVFHATGDSVTPYAGAEAFEKAMQAAGNRCELVTHEGGVHGHIVYDRRLYEDSLRRTDAFLRSLKLLE